MKKRIALVLALVMIFSMLPMSAFGLSATGVGNPNPTGETAEYTNADNNAGLIPAGLDVGDPIVNSGNTASIKVDFTKNDFGLVSDLITTNANFAGVGGEDGVFEIRVQLQDGAIYYNPANFEFNYGGANYNAWVTDVYEYDSGSPGNRRPFDPTRKIDEFNVKFQVQENAINDPNSTSAFFTLRLNNVITETSDGQVTADLSSAYNTVAAFDWTGSSLDANGNLRAPGTQIANALQVRDNSERLFDGYSVWASPRLFTIGDRVNVWMKTVKNFSRGGMWADVGEIWFEEQVPGAWTAGEEITLTLPRGFHWDQNAVATLNDGDPNARDTRWVNAAPVLPTNYDEDTNIGTATKREVSITIPGGALDPTRASRFFVEGLRVMADRRVAETGEVVVQIGGDPTFDQNEMTIARYGSEVVEIERFEEDVKYVYSGNFQELNRLKIDESIWEAIPRNATIELTLPEGVKWEEPSQDAADVNNFNGLNYLPNNRAPELHGDSELEGMRFLGFPQPANLQTGQQDNIAWQIVDNNRQTIAATISRESTDRDSERLDAGGGRAGASLIFENLRVAIDTQYQNEDIPVQVQVAGWEEEVILGHAVPKVEVEVEEVVDVKLGVRGQQIGDILIEEFQAGAIDRGIQNNQIRLKLEGDQLSRHKFTKTPSAEVLFEGEARDAVQIERVWMNPSMDEINIQIKDFSDGNPSTIRVYDLELTIDRTAPEGAVEMFVGGGSLVDTVALAPGAVPAGRDIAAPEYFLHSRYLHNQVVLANVVNPAESEWWGEDEEEVEVGFTVGQTSYVVNGQTMTMDVAPFVQDGRMMVPVRYLEPVFGVQPSWSDSARTVTIPYEGAMYSMQIGSNQLMVNGTPMIDMEAPAQIVSERTFVPISRFARAMGIEYDWDAAAQSVTFFR